METSIAGSGDLLPVVAALARGQVVGVPTETVYGLAADALNPTAVARVFEAKERPFFDPLIVHLPDREWLGRLTTGLSPLAERLADAFWPGPLTMILKKTSVVPELVTSGLETVAVRMPSHPLFAALLQRYGKPLAAPSANRFGRISPTSVADVMDELGGRIPLILDGGPCRHGIESTIVIPGESGIAILRHGPVSAADLSVFGAVTDARDLPQTMAPGQLESHYAPLTPLRIGGGSPQVPPGRSGLLAFSQGRTGFAAVEVLSPGGDPIEAAANLFGAMRRLDRLGLDLIVADPVPETGIGVAIMERLRKAAHSGCRSGSREVDITPPVT